MLIWLETFQITDPEHVQLSSNQVYTTNGTTSVALDFISYKSLDRNGFEMQYEAGLLLPEQALCAIRKLFGIIFFAV